MIYRTGAIITRFWILKFIYSEKATKFLWNLPLTLDYSTYGQNLGEDFAKFCGLLRIYELYQQTLYKVIKSMYYVLDISNKK